MASSGPGRRIRQPTAELVIFIVGGAGVAAAIVLDSGPLLVASILACMAAVLSVVFSVFLSGRAMAVHIASLLLGAAGIAYGTNWYLGNQGSTEILFSPVFVAYFGAGLLLAGVLNLVDLLRNQ
ncbi:hypothetical protein [Lolliginicoccus suaedae]|uniref:hypothetical protein n=1 Tax=Lolliginicoccus suaedae TaxID=2605429 RepID=UPI0011EFA775|nr:hypothetical protein [Lolliginicoccus suaedae]